MESNFVCPACKSSYEIQPDFCTKCGFPFSGSEKEKSVFIGQQIFKKGKVADTKNKIKRARIILWVIGALNAIGPFVLYVNDPMYATYTTAGVIIGIVFTGFGFLTYRKPFISILIPLIILIISYLVEAINEPISLIQGIIWKVIFLGGLIYGLTSIIEAEKIRKENEFLKEQKYK
jgi:hypothetical protein